MLIVFNRDCPDIAEQALGTEAYDSNLQSFQEPNQKFLHVSGDAALQDVWTFDCVPLRPRVCFPAMENAHEKKLCNH